MGVPLWRSSMQPVDNETERPDGLSRRQARFATCSCFSVLTPVALIYLTLIWGLAVQPEIYRARLDKVHTGMRVDEVRYIMGLPRAERRETARGWPGQVVWEYRWATITFGTDGRVLRKEGHFEFD